MEYQVIFKSLDVETGDCLRKFNLVGDPATQKLNIRVYEGISCAGKTTTTLNKKGLSLDYLKFLEYLKDGDYTTQAHAQWILTQMLNLSSSNDLHLVDRDLVSIPLYIYLHELMKEENMGQYAAEWFTNWEQGNEYRNKVIQYCKPYGDVIKQAVKVMLKVEMDANVLPNRYDIFMDMENDSEEKRIIWFQRYQKRAHSATDFSLRSTALRFYSADSAFLILYYYAQSILFSFLAQAIREFAFENKVNIKVFEHSTFEEIIY
jgi:hypothetical protein